MARHNLTVGSLLATLLVACSGGPAQAPPAKPPPLSGTVTLSIVGTNDLHGYVLGEGGKGGLGAFAGFLANLRAARGADGGAVILVDAGDAFQGTLESNLNEGEAVTWAYGKLGYAAMAIGNHEFDYGPVGPAATPANQGDDPRGALKARAATAAFPFLAANLIDSATGKPIDWPNVKPSTTLSAAGVKVGIIGVSTFDTPKVVISANFSGLEVAPLADTIAAEAKRLRDQGCIVVVVAAHAGARCSDLEDPGDTTSCQVPAEIFEVARALPPGAVDVIVGGHTHAGVAHMVAGLPIIESFKYGRAFGRVDLTVDRATQRVTARKIHPPRDIVLPAEYEGRPVTSDPSIEEGMGRFLAEAAVRRGERLGVTLTSSIDAAVIAESAEGNLIADLMRQARPADVAITNGGGLRADLPQGDLTYGQLFAAQPFDNNFAMLQITGADLRDLLRRNLEGSHGILSLSGVRASARCRERALVVEVVREDGKRIADGDVLTVTTSDFLATGGDDVFSRARPKLEDGPPIREVLVDLLRKRGGTLDAAAFHDPAKPRLDYQGPRPVRCE